MKSLPFELINIILSFRENHPLSNIITNLIKNFYEKDYNPNFAESCVDNYCNEYSFYEWYFYIIRNYYIYNFIFYKLTPKILNIGNPEVF